MVAHPAEASNANDAAPVSRTRPPILEALRAGTHAAHEAIERNAVMGRLTSPGLDRGHYVRVLKRMLALHRAMEGRLARALELHREALSLDQRRKSPLLRRDLMALDASEPDRPVDPVLACLVVDEPTAWGALYVLEGSTLGGRVILRNVERTLGLTAENGAAFFAGYGERTGERWKAFVEAIAAVHADRPEWEASIVAGAVGSFAAMDMWLAAE